MKINLQKMILDGSCREKIEFFKQINTCKDIKCENYIYKNKYIKKLLKIIKKKRKICKLETTIPKVKILSTNIIETIEGTSLEGQHLSGKKLIVVGKINVSLIITYHTIWNKEKKVCRDIIIPFNTFIIIPKDSCNINAINLRYAVEDVSLVQLCDTTIFISIVFVLQYLDEKVKEI